MNHSNNDCSSRDAKAPVEPAQPSKRFHIAKLEERIAPKGGKGTNNCGGGGGSSNNSGASSGWSGGYSIY